MNFYLIPFLFVGLRRALWCFFPGIIFPSIFDLLESRSDKGLWAFLYILRYGVCFFDSHYRFRILWGFCGWMRFQACNIRGFYFFMFELESFVACDFCCLDKKKTSKKRNLSKKKKTSKKRRVVWISIKGIEGALYL